MTNCSDSKTFPKTSYYSYLPILNQLTHTMRCVDNIMTQSTEWEHFYRFSHVQQWISLSIYNHVFREFYASIRCRYLVSCFNNNNRQKKKIHTAVNWEKYAQDNSQSVGPFIVRIFSSQKHTDTYEQSIEDRARQKSINPPTKSKTGRHSAEWSVTESDRKHRKSA